MKILTLHGGARKKGNTATTTFQMALANGLGSESKGALIKVFEKLLGIEVRKREGSE
jgi:hypothetical protein